MAIKVKVTVKLSVDDYENGNKITMGLGFLMQYQLTCHGQWPICVFACDKTKWPKLKLEINNSELQLVFANQSPERIIDTSHR